MVEIGKKWKITFKVEPVHKLDPTHKNISKE